MLQKTVDWMCGIFGQCCCSSAGIQTTQSTREKLDVLLEGLAALQYRGYDSCGIAWLENGQLRRVRAVGAVEALESRLNAESDGESATSVQWCAIAHTRWATHGAVAERNTHPHTAGGYALVHNGVVDNADSLRRHLVDECGAVLDSETDTELIVHLLAQQSCSEPLAQRVANAMKHVRGANAVAVISSADPHCVALWRRGSPLAIGFSSDAQHPHFVSQSLTEHSLVCCKCDESAVEGCFTFASDLSTLEPFAQRAVLLGEDDIAILCAKCGSCKVYYTGSQPSANVTAFHRDLRTSSTGSSECTDAAIPSIHADRNDGLCMWREIQEQPAALRRALAGRLNSEYEEVHLGGLSEYWHQIATAQRLVMIACGTSYYAALAARSLFEQGCGKPVLVERATPLLDRQVPIFRGDACFFLSQSGETADVLAALAHCRAAGALCIGVVNAVASSIARATDCGVYLKCGPEIAVASTKAFTAQISVLALIAAHLMPRLQRQTVLASLARAPTLVSQALHLSDAWAQHWAREWRDKQRCLILARGADEATAYEAALKIKELCYVLAEGCHAGELKHGPLALVDADLPVIAIQSENDSVVAQRMRTAVEQVRARHGNPIVVSNSAQKSALGLAKDRRQLILPAIGDDRLQCIVNIVPLQMLAFYWAKERALNVDRPRNLAKSVTVQ